MTKTKQQKTANRNPIIDKDIIHMLFELHHKQLSETRQSIRSLTEKAVGLFVLMAGWIVLSEKSPPDYLKVILVAGVVVIAVFSCGILVGQTKGRLRIASVIEKLNNYFGLYTKGLVLKDDAIYPREWSGYSSRSLMHFVGPHIATIVIVALLAIVSIIVK